MTPEQEAAFERAVDDIRTAFEESVTSLSFDGEEDLTELPGEIDELGSLTSLSLSGTGVRDFSTLTSLTALKHLDLRDTQVTDLSPLQSLTALKHLDLRDTQVTDLSPLQSLTALQDLDLGNTQVADLSPLQALTALRILYLDSTQVADLTPLQSLTSLQTLSLSSTPVADFSSFDSLTALQRLYLDNTQINDLYALQSLTALQRLYLDNTQINDLYALQSLTAMKRLDLRNTQVADLSPLRNHQALQNLLVSSSKVADLRPILTWPAFKLAAENKDTPYGLWLKDSAATKADPALAEIAEENEGDSAKRALLTLDHLATLPPWPEPLPWQKSKPKTPDMRPAPVMVRATDGVVLEQIAPDISLEAAQRQRAEEAWQALRAYIGDLADLRDKVHNQMPRLEAAIKSLSRALGDDFRALNQIDLGMQADRVRGLAPLASSYMEGQDAEEVKLFAATLALYMQRFSAWEDYKADVHTTAATLKLIKEDKSTFTELQVQLSDYGIASEDLSSALADLIAAATADGARPIEGKGLVDSEVNITSALAERALLETQAIKEEAPDIYERLNRESGEAIKQNLLSKLSISIPVYAISYMLTARAPLNRLASRYPAEFSFLKDVLAVLFPT